MHPITSLPNKKKEAAIMIRCLLKRAKAFLDAAVGVPFCRN